MGGGDFKVKLQASKTLLAEKSGYSILIIVALREIKHKSFFSFNLTVKSAKHEAVIAGERATNRNHKGSFFFLPLSSLFLMGVGHHTY